MPVLSISLLCWTIYLQTVELRTSHLSILNSQLSTVNCQLSTVNYLLIVTATGGWQMRAITKFLTSLKPPRLLSTTTTLMVPVLLFFLRGNMLQRYTIFLSHPSHQEGWNRETAYGGYTSNTSNTQICVRRAIPSNAYTNRDYL